MTEPKDFRRKLTLEQKEEIKNRYDLGEADPKKLAAEFGVSRGTINFIVHPERLEQFKKNRLGGWKKYYTTEKAREWKRAFRERRKAAE